MVLAVLGAITRPTEVCTIKAITQAFEDEPDTIVAVYMKNLT